MIMIIFYHFANWSHNPLPIDNISVQKLRYELIHIWWKIWVNIFVLVSWYYLTKSNTIKLKKILKFWFECLFYSLWIYLIYHIFSINTVTVWGLIDAFMPITSYHQWFLAPYLVMYILHPLLNTVCSSFDKSSHKKNIILLMLVWVIIPAFHPIWWDDFSNQVLWFISLYYVANYISRYRIDFLKIKKKILKSLIGSFFILYLIKILIIIIESKFLILPGYIHNIMTETKPYSITVLITSLLLFIFFTTVKMNYKKRINIIASTTFGIYLIHWNRILKPIIRDIWFNVQNYRNSRTVIPYSIIVVWIIFLICALIDILRQLFVEKYILKLIDDKEDYIKKKWNKILSSIKFF